MTGQHRFNVAAGRDLALLKAIEKVEPDNYLTVRDFCEILEIPSGGTVHQVRITLNELSELGYLRRGKILHRGKGKSNLITFHPVPGAIERYISNEI